jgi:hypothetical protein
MVLDAFYVEHAYDCFFVPEIIVKVPYFGKLCDNSIILYKSD